MEQNKGLRTLLALATRDATARVHNFFAWPLVMLFVMRRRAAQCSGMRLTFPARAGIRTRRDHHICCWLLGSASEPLACSGAPNQRAPRSPRGRLS